MDKKNELLRQRAEIDRQLIELNAVTADGVVIERGKTYLYDSGAGESQFTVPQNAQFKEEGVFVDDTYPYQKTYYYENLYFDPKPHYQKRLKQFENALEGNEKTVEAWKKNKEKYEKLLAECE